MAFTKVEALEDIPREGGPKVTKGKVLTVGKKDGSDLHPREAVRLLEEGKVRALPLETVPTPPGK